MTRSEELAALADEVEKADGPDRTLDARIWYAVVERSRPGGKIDQDMIGRWPAYTVSLDAGHMLVSDYLPGRSWRVGVDPDGVQRAAVYRSGAGRSPHDSIRLVNGATPALALTAAFLRALAASTGDAHVG